MINESANAWLKDIASEVTVQIEPRANIDIEKTLKDATASSSATAALRMPAR